MHIRTHINILYAKNFVNILLKLSAIAIMERIYKGKGMSNCVVNKDTKRVARARANRCLSSAQRQKTMNLVGKSNRV